jgi:hypothetical protein
VAISDEFTVVKSKLETIEFLEKTLNLKILSGLSGVE